MPAEAGLYVIELHAGVLQRGERRHAGQIADALIGMPAEGVQAHTKYHNSLAHR
jgi:hypothetical protein